MRSMALEKDDSAIPVSSVVSVVAHLSLFFIVMIPVQKIPELDAPIAPKPIATEIFYQVPHFQLQPMLIVPGVVPHQTMPAPARVPDRAVAPVPATAAASSAPAEATHDFSQVPVRPTSTSRITLPDAPEGIVVSGEPGIENRASATPFANPSRERGNGIRNALDKPGDNPTSLRLTDDPVRTVRNPINPVLPRTNNPSDPVLPRENRNPRDDGTSPSPQNLKSGPPASYGSRRILFQPALNYPSWAERDRVQATPRFHIYVSPDGRVSSVRLASSSGHSDLDRLAEENVRRWIYEQRPGQTEAREVAVKFTLKDAV